MSTWHPERESEAGIIQVTNLEIIQDRQRRYIGSTRDWSVHMYLKSDNVIEFPRRYDFFISYAFPDNLWAEWIASVLETAGFSVFLDSNVQQKSGNFVSGIANIVGNSSSILVLVSKAYVEKPDASEEWFTSLLSPEGDRRVIPIFLDNTQAPGLLRGRVGVELAGLSEEEAKETLLSALTPRRSKPASVPLFPVSSSPAFAQRSTVHEEPSSSAQKARAKAREHVFISYSHNDSVWLTRLLTFLKPLERMGKIEVWSDNKIVPGMSWKQEIEEALNRASVAVLMISSDFLASDFILDEEIPTLLRNAEQDGLIVMPLILRPSRFARTSTLSSFQSVNPPSSPLSALKPHQREQVMLRVSELIEDAMPADV